MPAVWTDEDREFIRANAATMYDVDIAEELTRRTGRPVSKDMVAKRRRGLGISKQPGRGVCRISNYVLPRRYGGLGLSIRAI